MTADRWLDVCVIGVTDDQLIVRITAGDRVGEDVRVSKRCCCRDGTSPDLVRVGHVGRLRHDGQAFSSPNWLEDPT